MSGSRQIRPPIYSLKQSKLRRRRVIRFAILCYTMLVLFLALVIGPAVVGQSMDIDIEGMMPQGLPFRLIQPKDLDNDNTNGTTMLTGTGADDYTGYLHQSMLSASRASAEAEDRPTDRIRLF